jgi:hypothetical protein
VIAQDREQPSRQIGARLETIDVSAGAQKCLLDQVLCLIPIMGQRNRERPQFRDQGQHLGLQFRNHGRGSSAGFSASFARHRMLDRNVSAADLIWGVETRADNARYFEWSL